MHPLYTVAELRAVEHAAAARLPPGGLIRRAGRAALRAALDLLPPAPAAVLVLAGPGNNGGDALEAAALLAQAGLRVTLWVAPSLGAGPADARRAPVGAGASPLTLASSATEAVAAGGWDLIVDGLFGIGLARPLRGGWAELVGCVNRSGRAVLALDLPSGLDADSGALPGPDGVAIRASHTLTFIGDKPGLHTCDGRDYAGHVQVAPLGLEAGDFPATQLRLNDPADFRAALPPRRQNSHKGSFGDVAVLGGAPGMAGAAVLSARAALCSGAGRVCIAFAGRAPLYDGAHPELMCRAADGFDLNSATLVAGPGLGDAPAARALLSRALGSARALVLDADALNLLAVTPALRAALARRPAPAILTPHPLEAARLLGADAAAVQSDRLAAARRLAGLFRATVVLKGSGSVIAAPDGKVAINPTGNPALATAGTGDVLSGLCGALLAQGAPAWEAALMAVWLHGAAADALVDEGVGPVGLSASELIPAIRRVLNRATAAPRR